MVDGINKTGSQQPKQWCLKIESDYKKLLRYGTSYKVGANKNTLIEFAKAKSQELSQKLTAIPKNNDLKQIKAFYQENNILKLGEVASNKIALYRLTQDEKYKSEYKDLINDFANFIKSNSGQLEDLKETNISATPVSVLINIVKQHFLHFDKAEILDLQNQMVDLSTTYLTNKPTCFNSKTPGRINTKLISMYSEGSLDNESNDSKVKAAKLLAETLTAYYLQIKPSKLEGGKTMQEFYSHFKEMVSFPCDGRLPGENSYRLMRSYDEFHSEDFQKKILDISYLEYGNVDYIKDAAKKFFANISVLRRFEKYFDPNCKVPITEIDQAFREYSKIFPLTKYTSYEEKMIEVVNSRIISLEKSGENQDELRYCQNMLQKFSRISSIGPSHELAHSRNLHRNMPSNIAGAFIRAHGANSEQ